MKSTAKKLPARKPPKRAPPRDLRSVPKAAPAPVPAMQKVAELPDTASIQSRAMLVSISIRAWNPKRTDKVITEDVAKSHQIEKGWGEYKRTAINVKHPAWVKLINRKARLRDRYYQLTLPWGRDGSRILTTALFEKFSEEMRGLTREFLKESVPEFCDVFPELVTAAKQALNGAFNDADYPEHIAAKFDVEWHFGPLPAASDFRADLSTGAVKDIRSDIEDEVNRSMREAMKEPYSRLYDAISRLADRCADKPVDRSKKKSQANSHKRFSDTLITGLQDLIECLPAFNITNDPQLEALRVQAGKLIEGVSADALREVPTTRQRVATDARKMRDTMSAYMGSASTVDDEEDSTDEE